jgi:hypothetical protein
MGGNGHGDGRPALPPLEWREVDTLESGQCVLEIRQATLESGEVRTSFMFGRKGREGRLTKFFRPDDVTDLEQLLEDYRAWQNARAW